MSEKTIDSIRYAAICAELSGAAILIDIPREQLARDYNGIGADWMPAEVRAKITEWLSLFEPAALIHDLRYTRSNGTRPAFDAANEEFRDNCRALADYAYPWYSWRRYRARAIASALYACVASEGGWRAWTDAAKKRGTNDAEFPQH